jgi:hypothetical protein
MLVGGVCAQRDPTQPDPAVLLREARVKIVGEAEKLARYTCVETVQRSRFEPLTGERGGRCNLLARTMLAWTDRLRLDVTVSAGAEIFSWAGAKKFETARAQDFGGGGLTSAGDFGRFPISIFGDAAETQFTGWEESVAVYRYRVPVAASGYEIAAGTRAVAMAYEGKFWIDSRNLELKRLTVEVPDPPRAARTCRIETRIDYQRSRMGGGALTLPQLTQVKLWDADGSRWENRTTYASCRAFESESVFRTDMAGTVADAAATQTRSPLAAGLTLEIGIGSPIDEARAFAGDAIEGELLSEVRSAPGRVAAPRGTRVQGRIVRAERHLQPSRYFALGLRFDAITLAGEEVPLELEFVPRSREDRLLNGAAEKRAGIGMFFFNAEPVEVDAGFATVWKTRAH